MRGNHVNTPGELPPASWLTIEGRTLKGPMGETYPRVKVKKRIKWGRICGVWFLLVLGYLLVTSKRVPHDEVPTMVEQTQMLMGIALLPAIVRIYYRTFFRD